MISFSIVTSFFTKAYEMITADAKNKILSQQIEELKKEKESLQVAWAEDKKILTRELSRLRRKITKLEKPK